MDAEEYIALYGANLSEADKRYIRAFGAPPGFIPGSSRSPSTPGLTVADAASLQRSQAESEREDLLRAADVRNREMQDMMDEEEAAAFGELG
jgi:hypothetical protein